MLNPAQSAVSRTHMATVGIKGLIQFDLYA